MTPEELEQTVIQIVGAAAIMLSKLDGEVLPKEVVTSGLVLAKLIDSLPEDYLEDALHEATHFIPTASACKN